MVILKPMGRRKLNRTRMDITLPDELRLKSLDLAAAEGRPVSHLIESLIRPYVEKNWAAAMKPAKPGRRPSSSK